MVEDDIAITACTIWHIIERRSFLLGRRINLWRAPLHPIEARLGLWAMIVTHSMQSTVCKDDMAVSTGSVTPVSNILLVVRPIYLVCHVKTNICRALLILIFISYAQSALAIYMAFAIYFK